jgi:hypothetical protein
VQAEVWIADGVYVPAPPNGPITSHFALRNGVALYGGFDGGERSIAERDPTVYLSILSGDLLADDVPGEVGLWQNIDDNVRNVVRGSGVNASARLDGLNIRHGMATSTPQIKNDRGAALRLEQASPTIVDCTVEDNVSDWGGAVYAKESVLHFERCTFRRNRGATAGGGVLIEGEFPVAFIECVWEGNVGGSGAGLFLGTLSPSAAPGPIATIDRCQFRENRGPIGASSGMGFFALLAHVTVCDSRFDGNTTVGGGGGAYLSGSLVTFARCDFVGNVGQGDGGGALYANGLDTTSAQVHAIDCRFVGNNGVAVAVGGGDPNGSLRFTNCSMVSNSPALEWSWPIVFCQAPSTVHLRNCIARHHTPIGKTGLAGHFISIIAPGISIDRSCIEDWDGSLPGEGNIAADPLFVDRDGEDDMDGTWDDDLRLSPGSPCIDQSEHAFRTIESRLDVSGSPRFIDDPHSTDAPESTAPVADLGALEFQASTSCLADLDGDGSVGGADLAVLLGGWNGVGAGNLNGSGVIDAADLAILLGAWGACPDP